MLIVMEASCTPEQVESVMARIRSLGLTPEELRGPRSVAIGVSGDGGAVEPEAFAGLPGVAAAVSVSRKARLVSRDTRPADSVVDVGGVRIGDGSVTVIAGPCSVEGRDQILRTARAVKDAGARILRGGAYKPRTSPYDFQGLREEGLELLALAREETGLRIATEVKDTETLALVARHADLLQVGARNMQNFSLLERIGALDLPVLLKRGMSATLDELLMAAEYIVSKGNPRVILCERGIRTFETATRNTLDINAVPLLKALSHLPVVVDPSHAVGLRRHVPAVARAALAAGADGLLIEVHPDPDRALSDGAQSLSPPEFAALMADLRAIAAALSRPFPAP